MNEILSLPRVVEIMAANADIDSAASERFIKAFFSHLEDALAVSESVIIDGLGVFMRSDDPDNPIKFIADQALIEAINQPFEMFEPIAVGDIDLTAEIEPQTAETKVATPPALGVDLQTAADGEPEIKHVDEPVSDPIAEVTGHNSEKDNAIVSDEIEYPAQSVVLDEEPHQKHTAIWICIAFLLGLVIGAVISFLSHDRLQTIFGTENDDISTILPDDSDVEEQVSLKIETPDEKYQEADEDEAPVQAIKTEVYDTVTPNRFLTTMARQYYGPVEYWAFIYEANADHLGNPNRIKPGTRVLIPDRSEFETDGSTEATINRAKRIGREIYSRYE